MDIVCDNLISMLLYRVLVLYIAILQWHNDANYFCDFITARICRCFLFQISTKKESGSIHWNAAFVLQYWCTDATYVWSICLCKSKYSTVCTFISFVLCKYRTLIINQNPIRTYEWNYVYSEVEKGCRNAVWCSQSNYA